MTHIENLKVNDWVAVTGHAEVDSDDYNIEYTMFGPIQKKKPDYSGFPVKILAISAPFICVTDGNGSEALDLRKVCVTKVNQRYVKSMHKGKHKPIQQVQSINTVATNFNLPELQNIVTTSDNAITIDYPKTCPLCHEAQMTEHLAEGEREWRLTCPSCGFEGKRPKKKGQDEE